MNEENQERLKRQIMGCYQMHHESEDIIRRAVRHLEVIVTLQGAAITMLAVALIIHILAT